MSSQLADSIREVLGSGWPHDYDVTLSRLADHGYAMHRTPPVYFVGDVPALAKDFILHVSLNPNIDPSSADGRAELDLLMPGGAVCSYDDYFEHRCGYFESQAFDWKFYRPHAHFAAGWFGKPPPTRDERGRVLASTSIAVDLCPFSGRTPPPDRLIATWIEQAQNGAPASKPFGMAFELLQTLLRARPVAVVARFQSANLALRRLLIADNDSVGFEGFRIPYTWFNEPNGAVSSHEAYERGRRMRSLNSR